MLIVGIEFHAPVLPAVVKFDAQSNFDILSNIFSSNQRQGIAKKKTLAPYYKNVIKKNSSSSCHAHPVRDVYSAWVKTVIAWGRAPGRREKKRARLSMQALVDR